MALGPHWQHAWLVIASFLAGALNAMAGGGSFLSFPALLGVGVPPIQANATNTVALWPGQFTSIAAYWQDLKANLRLVLPVCSAALLGGVAGSHRPASYRPGHLHGAGAVAVAARRWALCRQRSGLGLAAGATA